MLKHRGFPGRLPGTDFQFTIRRANVKGGATKIIKRERFKDRKHADRMADQGFMAALWAQFGEEPFERGNLDAGRLSWLFGREVADADIGFTQALQQVPLLLAWGQEWGLQVQRELQQRELPSQEPLQQVLQLLQQEQASCLLLQERYAACALREAQ